MLKRDQSPADPNHPDLKSIFFFFSLAFSYTLAKDWLDLWKHGSEEVEKL